MLYKIIFSRSLAKKNTFLLLLQLLASLLH